MALPPGSRQHHQASTNTTSLPQGLGLLLPPPTQLDLQAERMPKLHQTQPALQEDHYHLQIPSRELSEKYINIQKEEEYIENKNQLVVSSNQKDSHLQYCENKEKSRCDILETETFSEIDIEKNTESSCVLKFENETNSDNYNNKDVLDNISCKSTNSNKSTDRKNKSKVQSDKNNNLKKKNSNTSITSLTSISSNTSTNSNSSVTINNRKISDVVILINNEECDGKEIDSQNKNHKLKARYPIYNKQRLIPPLNKASSTPTLKVPTQPKEHPNVHTLKIAPPLNKVASAPELRISPNFTDYKNSYLQRNPISELTLKKESPRESINIKKQQAKKISLEKIKMVKSNICLFCGEGSQLEGTGLGQLITFCQCRASAHSDCLTSYITFPLSSHDRCCVCRGKLQYTVIDKDTPMQIRYAILLLLIVMAYFGLILFSIHFTQALIPMGEIHEFLYLLIIGNLGFIPPALVVFIITCLLNFRRPQPKLGDSNENSLIPKGGFSTWFGCNSEDCEEKNCGGDTCGFILAAFCLLSVMVVLISASIYIFYNVYLYYKSFKLKSKKSIRFSCDRNNKNVYKV